MKWILQNENQQKVNSSLLFCLHGAVLSGGHLFPMLELFREVAGIVVTNLRCDVLDWHVGMAKQGRCLLNSLVVQKVNERKSHFLMELRGEVVCIDRKLRGGILYRDVIRKMCLDIGHGKVNQGLEVGVGVILYEFTVLLQGLVNEVVRFIHGFELFNTQAYFG
jgi:hypothetical protein